jgi:competence protein ComEA
MKQQLFDWLNQYRKFLSSDKVQLVFAIVAFLPGCLGLGLGLFYLPSRNTACQTQATLNQVFGQVDPAGENSSLQNSPSSASSSGRVVVDISGAVQHPGIYELTQDERVFTALEKAGGLTANADLGYVQQHLNLAEKVVEAEKIYFPPRQTQTDTPSNQSSSSAGINNLISLNFSSAAELDSLPDLGEKLSAKIIAGRPYHQLSELVTRVKISQSIFDKLKNLIQL